LGFAIVKKFYEHGAMVFALDKNKKHLEALKDEFPNVTTINVDLRDWNETQRLIKAVAPIDHLVNNAAISGTSFFEEVVSEQIDEYACNNYYWLKLLKHLFAEYAYYIPVGSSM
jgi:NADP-dependent 3-hydroxy acid dehydrogenase YdfG